MLAVLEDSYCEEVKINEDGSENKRIFLKIPPLLAPFFVAIIPLSKQLKEKAYQLYLSLLFDVDFNVAYEDAHNIGKAYRRQDAIGTFYCLVIDFQTMQDETVTLRNRDSMKQEKERINIFDLKNHLNELYIKKKQEFIK
jgi:glycyl-tRNA synthetase